MTVQEQEMPRYATISAAKRQAILDASKEIFLKQGFAGSGMAEIARVADVSTATLYKHFSSKEELFRIVIERAYPQWEEEFDLHDGMEGKDAHQCLTDAIVGVITSNQWTQALQVTSAVLGEIASSPNLGEELLEHETYSRHKSLERLLDKLVAREKLAAHDTALGARLLWGMVRELIEWPRYLVRHLRTPDNIEKLVSEAVATYVERHVPR